MHWERAERKEMEEAFKRQAEKVDVVLQQNQELVVRLIDLEKLWVAEEQFTMELRGRIEALQVRSPLWGSCTLMMTNISRTRPASADWRQARRFLLRYLVVPEPFCYRELIQYF